LRVRRSRRFTRDAPPRPAAGGMSSWPSRLVGINGGGGQEGVDAGEAAGQALSFGRQALPVTLVQASGPGVGDDVQAVALGDDAGHVADLQDRGVGAPAPMREPSRRLIAPSHYPTSTADGAVKMP